MKFNRPKSNQPIPDHAVKVFEGKIFSVFQWQQQMFDGSTQTFEKLKRTDTVNVIPVTDEGKLIFTQQKQPGVKPFTGSVGGRIDSGETPLEAAKREMLEETGYQANQWRLWFSFQPFEKIDWAIYSFIASDIKKTQEPQLDSGEKIKLITVSFNQLINDLIIRPDFRDHEISLRLLKASSKSGEIESIRRIFYSSSSSSGSSVSDST